MSSPVTRWERTRWPRMRLPIRAGRGDRRHRARFQPARRARRRASRYWDGLADGLETGGVDGFLEAYDQGLDPDWRETMLRITRERLSLHRDPGAVAQALREVPRSRPFDDLSELELCEIPALVVASHDDADPGHPYAVAEQWAERLPHATLISEEEGASPLAWQGGKLSREIAAFCERDEVDSGSARPPEPVRTSRFSRRWTMRSPDQVSSIAQTLLSTRPARVPPRAPRPR